jgi:hypothetical protein
MAVHALHLVHPDPKYGRAPLVEPTTLGYILIGAQVQPRPAPFVPNSRDKTALLTRLQSVARQLAQLDAVERVTVYDAVAFAPPSAYVRAQGNAIHIPRFDVVVLVETQSPAAARDIQTTGAYQALINALATQASQMYVVAARNVKRIADVDKTRPGVFLFNYFVADDPEVALDLWDYLAGWYTAEAGLDNSTLLVPLEGERSDYLAINHARWDGSLLGLFLRQLTSSSFRTYMLANLDANRVGAMPVLYRLAADKRRSKIPVFTLGVLTAGALILGTALILRRRRG